MVVKDFILGLLLLFSLLFSNCVQRNDTDSSTISSEDDSKEDVEPELSLSYVSAEHMLSLMKTNFGQYLEKLPSLLQSSDGPISQAARMALYWNKVDDLHTYYHEIPLGDTVDVSPLQLPPTSFYSHYAVFISPQACEKLNLLEWVQAGGTAASLVNSLTPIPLGILYRNVSFSKTAFSRIFSTLETSRPVLRKLLRNFERKLSIFSSCYAIILSKADLSKIPGSFFSFSELDAPLLSGFKFSNLIQLSQSSKESVSYFLQSENEFTRTWLPSDFWRSIKASNWKDKEDVSDFTLINEWVRVHYFDLENSFFAKGFRSDTFTQARRTCFLLHRALSSFVWEVDKLPRYPAIYSTNLITIIESMVMEQIFLKFGTLPSAEEIETSPELAFKVLGHLSTAKKHFFDRLVWGDALVNLRRSDLPPLELAVGRISIEYLLKIPGWPYLLERFQLTVDNFSWKEIPENWFSTLEQDDLYPLYDGKSWSFIRTLKTIVKPGWILLQRSCHFFSFITVESLSRLNPIQQLDLILHPDAKENLSPQVLSSLSPDRFRLLYQHAAVMGSLPILKERTREYYGHLIRELEEELDDLKLQLQGISFLDKQLQEKISSLE